jgi:hypothetical protein
VQLLCLNQFIFKSCCVLGQKWVSKNGNWPEPSKYAHVYENLLANCPYRKFFDTATLCDPANAKSVRQLSQLQDEDEKKAKAFFNATFRSGTNVIKALHCKLT